MLVKSSLPPSLCSNTAQVTYIDYNQLNAKDLQRESIVDILNEMDFNDIAYDVKECGDKFAHFKDKNGHEKYSRMFCKNEFCPTCGRKDSQAHKRRATRAMDRLIWTNVLGYMVFTLPKEVSVSRPDKEVLYNLSKKAWQIVKENFITSGGLTRVHLMGEKAKNFHIHMNVLFPNLNPDGLGRVEQDVLDKIREAWTKFVNEYFELNCKNTDVKYKYYLEQGRKLHKVYYVLRPIVTSERFLTLSEDGRRYVLSLRGWHNSRWYGELANSRYRKFLESRGVDVSKFGSGGSVLSKCPICGETFKYLGFVFESDIPRSQGRWFDKDTFISSTLYALKEKIPKESEVLNA